MEVLDYVKKYYWCFEFHDNRAKVGIDEDENFAFIDEKGVEIKKDWFYDVVCDHTFSCGRLRIQNKSDNKIFYVDTNFEKISDDYSFGYPYKNGFARVQKNDGRYTFIDLNGKMMDLSAKSLEDFTDDGIAGIMMPDGRYTYINNTGKTFSYMFDSISSFRNGMAIASKNYRRQKSDFCVLSNSFGEFDSNAYDEIYENIQHCYIVNKDFEIISEFETTAQLSIITAKFDSGKFIVYSDNDCVSYFIDTNGKVTNTITNVLTEPSDGYVAVKLSDLSENIYDIKNNDFIICDKKYSLIEIQDKMCMTHNRMTGKYTFIDMDGEPLDEEFEKVGDFYYGLAVVQFDNGKYGFINKKGEHVLNEFCYVESFSEDFAIVRPTEKCEYCFINKEGRYLIDFSKFSSDELKQFLDEFPEYKNDVKI